MADPVHTYSPADAQVLSRWRRSVDRMVGFVRRVMDEQPGKSLTTHPERGMVFDFTDKDDRLAALRTYSTGADVVYFCGTADNKDGISYDLEIGYARLLDSGTGAYVGVWLNRGDTFIDSIMIPDDCKDDDVARSYMARHGQRCISKLTAKKDKNCNITNVRLTFVGR